MVSFVICVGLFWSFVLVSFVICSFVIDVDLFCYTRTSHRQGVSHHIFIGKVVSICLVGSVNLVLKFLGQPGETRLVYRITSHTCTRTYKPKPWMRMGIDFRIDLELSHLYLCLYAYRCGYRSSSCRGLWQIIQVERKDQKKKKRTPDVTHTYTYAYTYIYIMRCEFRSRRGLWQVVHVERKKKKTKKQKRHDSHIHICTHIHNGAWVSFSQRTLAKKSTWHMLMTEKHGARKKKKRLTYPNPLSWYYDNRNFSQKSPIKETILCKRDLILLTVATPYRVA